MSVVVLRSVSAVLMCAVVHRQQTAEQQLQLALESGDAVDVVSLKQPMCPAAALHTPRLQGTARTDCTEGHR